jgi:hypothetical protein
MQCPWNFVCGAVDVAWIRVKMIHSIDHDPELRRVFGRPDFQRVSQNLAEKSVAYGINFRHFYILFATSASPAPLSSPSNPLLSFISPAIFVFHYYKWD